MNEIKYDEKLKRFRSFVELPPNPLTGKRMRKFIYGGTKEEVKDKLFDIIMKVRTGCIDNSGKTSLQAYLNLWVEVYCKHLADTTVDGYKIYIEKHINPCIGNAQLNKLKPIQIQALYNKMKDDGYKGKSILQCHRILSKALKDAVKNELIPKNPCANVDTPKAEAFEPTICTQKDFIRLLDAIKGTTDELPVLLAGMCGLRRSEVFGLRWSDIDFDNQTISIKKAAVCVRKKGVKEKETKNTSSTRTFTIPSAIIGIFKKHKGIGLVCPYKDGKHTHGGNYSHHFKYLLEKHKIPHIRFHDLRHFNATMMLRYGVSDKEASKRLGHSTPEITKKLYQHVLKEMDQQSADKLNQIISK